MRIQWGKPYYDKFNYELTIYVSLLKLRLIVDYTNYRGVDEYTPKHRRLINTPAFWNRIKRLFSKKPRRCGHPECHISTNIADQTSAGRGNLDDNGFWEFPCRQCEVYFRHRDAERRLKAY